MTAVLAGPELACPPRFGTRRDPSRSTLGPAVGKVAAKLGKPLMPWQQYVVDVALEIDSATGRLVYDEVDLTVPRQSGKTTLKLAKATHRCTATSFFGARQHLVYTAQTRNKAREKFIEDFAPDLLASPTFKARVRPHWGNGNEHLRFVNGSRFAIEATTEKAGHGSTVDEAYIDEAFAQQDDRLEQAFDPAMVTRQNKQLWVVSTAGWLNGSPYLLDKVLTGRQAVDFGDTGSTAVFEWSAEDDADPEDPAVWRRCMPALGYTVTEAAIRSALDKAIRKGNLNGFRRAYLNQWVLKDAPEEAIIDPLAWAALEDVAAERPKPVVFSFATSPDRTWSYIALAGTRDDGNTHLQVVKANRGTGWVVDELVRLRDEWKPTGIAVDASDPAASLIPDLEKKRVKVTTLQRRDVARGSGMLVDGVEQQTVRHGGGKLLSMSLAAARQQRMGESWVFAGPKDGSVDIAPLKAVTVALYGLATSNPQRRSGLVVGLR